MGNAKKTLRLILVFLLILIVIPLSTTGCAPCTPQQGGMYDGCCFDDWAGEWCCVDDNGHWTCNS